MSSKHRKKNGTQNGKHTGFVMVFWDLLNSEAVKTMTHSAQAALIYFLGKPKLHPKDPDYYNIVFDFTYKEARRCGFAKATFYSIIKQLVCNGFIDPIDKGGLRGKGYSSSTFSLSRRWKKYGTSDFTTVNLETFEPPARKTSVQK